MAKRRVSRWLAPLALIAVLGAILAVINNSDVGTDTKKKSSSGDSAQTITGSDEKKSSSKKQRSRRTYTVHSGDTLSAISAKTGIPLAEIQRLNPGIDEQTLQAGQKIKLVASS